jgi:hypothetical protein
VDLLQVKQRGSLAFSLASARGILLRSCRLPLWEAGLGASSTSPAPSSSSSFPSFLGGERGMTVVLNHLPALELEARGEVDVGAQVTVFAQAFRALHVVVSGARGGTLVDAQQGVTGTW